MASAPVNLNAGPPPPPGLSGGGGSSSPPSPSPSIGGLAGQQQQDPSPTQHQAVIQQMALAEQALFEAGRIMPELAPVVDDITNQLRTKGMRAILSSMQGGNTSPAPMMSGLIASAANAPMG